VGEVHTIEINPKDIVLFKWKACKEYFNNSCAYCELPIEKHYRIIKWIMEDCFKYIEEKKPKKKYNRKNNLKTCVV